ncbi:hypothetical protein FRC01_008919 [Tulasnella sp. 417]|nr:hypothetical protein FRC01_008919 [Tulasnella sp. 417]
MADALPPPIATTVPSRKRKRELDTSTDDRPRSRKASLQDDAYKKDMYLVFVKNTLKEKSQGNPTEFDQLVARFNKTGTKDQSPSELRLWISALKHVVSSLERIHSPLVNVLITFPWTIMEDEFARSYVDLMAMIISARPEYLGPILAQIALGFTARYVGDLNSSKGREASFDAGLMYERQHILLQRLLSLIPTLSTTLEPLLIRNFPHKRQDKAEQIAYIQNVLKLSEYCQELRDRILGLVVDRAIQIDVEIQVELEDLDEGLLESATIQEDDASGESSEEDDPSDNLSINSDDEDYRKEEKTSLKKVTEMLAKLDAILKLLFDHLNVAGALSPPPRPRSSSSDSESGLSTPTFIKPEPVSSSSEEDLESLQATRRSQFLTLLTIFDRTILRTFKSRYTQFLLFWHSALDPEYTDLFLGLLVSRALFEQDQPAVTRSAAASYIASLVSRALFVDRDSARRVVGLLCEYLDGQLGYADDLLAEAQRNGELGSDGFKISASHFSVFYAVAQAVFLVFCFRWRDFEIAPDESEDSGNRTGKKWVAELDVVQRTITSPLNPLKHCSQNVVKQFAKISQKTGFVYCYGVLENNKRAEWAASVYSNSTASTPVKFPSGASTPATPRHPPRQPVPVPPSPARLFVVADSAVENDVNAFFPFDPYKLPGSSSFIDDIYREWSMVALDEGDSEEEEDGDDQDVVVGEMGEEEEEMSAISLAVFTWILVFRNNPHRLGYFAFHPPLQTLALVLFVFAILNLQRTTLANPVSKRKGQLYHQIFGGLALTSITLGFTAMIANKASHGWRHFASWHARFGLLTYILLVIQALVGAGSLWFGGAVMGGGEKAKAVYKYHRASGYTIITLMLVTVHLAGGWTDWVAAKTTVGQRVLVYTALPCLIWTGLAWRVR